MGRAAVPPGPPRAGEGKRGEAGYLGYLLRQAAAAYRLRLDRELAPLGVTPPQFAVLTMINAYPGLSNADIARTAVLTPQTTGDIIANLERAGLIGRRPHMIHGRILHVELTPSGARLLKKCRVRAQKIEDELVQGFEGDDMQAIRRWLAAVAQINQGARHPAARSAR